MPNTTMPPYDAEAYKAIQRWENPEQSWFSKAVKYASKPFNLAGSAVINTPLLGDMLQKCVQSCLSLTNDLASLTARERAIVAEYRGCGYPDVGTVTDIAALSLENCDKTVGYLAAKYTSMAAVEGGTAGFTGLPGVVADIPALIFLCLRAVNEYAMYYGFDVTAQAERVFVMSTLSSVGNIASKQTMLTQLNTLSGSIFRQTWKQLSEDVLVKTIKGIAEELGIRLAKQKLAQSIPGIGAVVGAGFNTWYMTEVCETAYNVYRKRFLQRKYPDNELD